jgi:hypothetical protein
VQLSKGGGPSLLDADLRLSAGDRLDLHELMVRRQGPWDVGPRLSLLSFLGGQSRAQVLGGTVVGVGLSASRRAWPAPGMALLLDASAASGRSTQLLGARRVPFGYQLGSAGVALAWQAQPRWLGGTTLLAGPRLSALWLERRFELDLAGAPQRYLTFTPGLLLGVQAPLPRGFSAGAELHLDWTVMRVDGQDRSTGLGQLLLGVGYRF